MDQLTLYEYTVHVNQFNLSVLIKIKMTIFYNQDSKNKTLFKTKIFNVSCSFLISH